ncbi:hypothetical protein KM043_015511 [Ampulex compressa]|nr:hypothetical protein KM043_015511 [Ampulex compressa]
MWRRLGGYPKAIVEKDLHPGVHPGTGYANLCEVGEGPSAVKHQKIHRGVFAGTTGGTEAKPASINQPAVDDGSRG